LVLTSTLGTVPFCLIWGMSLCLLHNICVPL
jgi:hypothetical protein